MKDRVISLLRQRLMIVEHSIEEYQESITYSENRAKQPHMENAINNLKVLRERLTDYKQQRTEIEQCITWVESL